MVNYESFQSAGRKVVNYAKGIFLAANPKNSRAVGERDWYKKRAEEASAYLLETRARNTGLSATLEQKQAEVEVGIAEIGRINQNYLEQIAGLEAGHAQNIARLNDEREREKARYAEAYAELERKHKFNLGTIARFGQRLREYEIGSLRSDAVNYMAEHPAELVIAVGINDGIVEISSSALERLGVASKNEVLGRDAYSFIERGDEVKQRVRRKIAAALKANQLEHSSIKEVFQNWEIINPNTGKREKLDIAVVPHFGPERSGFGVRRHYAGVIIYEHSILESLAHEPWFGPMLGRIKAVLERMAKRRKPREDVLSPAALEIRQSAQAAYDQLMRRPTGKGETAGSI